MSTASAILGLAAFVILVALAATTGTRFKPGAWYESLDRPAWTPPNWLFPVAWTVLYLTIALAGWWVWLVAGFNGTGSAFVLFACQLVLNAAWSWLFFGLHRMDLAFVDITLLWFTIVANIFAFHAFVPGAAYLLVPYLVWVTYAAALNLTIWQMNSGMYPPDAS